jgi:hypothetical protein
MMNNSINASPQTADKTAPAANAINQEPRTSET